MLLENNEIKIIERKMRGAKEKNIAEEENKEQKSRDKRVKSKSEKI